MRGRRFPRVPAYATVAADCSPDGFAGARAITVTPMITSTAEPMRKPVRSVAIAGDSVTDGPATMLHDSVETMQSDRCFLMCTV